MDVAGRGEGESIGELAGEVADNVAEEIVGDDDVELAGVADEFDGEGVDIEVAGVDVGVLGTDGFEDALSEVAAKVMALDLSDMQRRRGRGLLGRRFLSRR